MNNLEFIEKLKNVVNNYKTAYMWGTFGTPITESSIVGKVKQYPSNYTSDRQFYLRSLIGKNAFGFDCVNLIKGILWGWCGDSSKTYGGAIYASNGVPDTNANGFINLCKEISTDFSKITPGEAIWRDGHIGVYIGDGKCIEAYNWGKPVEVRGVSNIKASIAGITCTSWTKHGKIPYITYVNDTTTQPTSPINPPTVIETPNLVVPAYTIERYIVTASTLNCRKGPTTNDGILGAFSTGYLITGLQKQNNWVFVSDGILTGWCSLDYLKKV